jgi:hypothetical protein
MGCCFCRCWSSNNCCLELHESFENRLSLNLAFAFH